MQNGCSNGNKVWSTIFDGIRNTWPLLVALVAIVATFSGDRASIIQSVKNAEKNISKIEKTLEEIKESQHEVEKQIIRELDVLHQQVKIMKFRIEDLDNKVN